MVHRVRGRRRVLSDENERHAEDNRSLSRSSTLLLTEGVLHEAEPTTLSETSSALPMTGIVTAEMVTADDWSLLCSRTCCGSLDTRSPFSAGVWYGDLSGGQEGPGFLCLTRWPTPAPPIGSSCSQSCHQPSGPMGLLPPAQAWEAQPVSSA